MKDCNVIVRSILGMNTGKALVELQMPSQNTTIEAADARNIGMQLIEAAEAAEHDRIVFEMLTEEVGSTVESAAAFIQDLRKRRSER